MVSIWLRSDTFAHGFVIVPISAWLIWRRRHDLAVIEIRPSFLALLALALAGFGWLLGELAGVGAAQQFCLVTMISLMVWAIAGYKVVAALAFPLFFLLFAVPFGEFLEPPMMEQTANFTVAALRATGIPVYREGLFFTIPTGNWSIVEACSGLRYLIASVTVGFLYAYLTYHSLARRAAFVAASILVPIVANWLRAYMIVMIGHLSNMKYAAGVDHVIYGWLFFGLVMLLLFWVGSFWREDMDSAMPVPDRAVQAATGGSSPAATVAATIAVAAIAAIWPVAAAKLLDAGDGRSPALHAPEGAGGWRQASGPLTTWTPNFQKSRAAFNQAYDGNTSRAGIYIGYYRNQQPGAQLISSQNELVSTRNPYWKLIAESDRDLKIGSAEIPAVQTILRGPATKLLVWRWYWVDGRYVVNPYWAKVLHAKARLFGRGDDGAVIIIFTPYAEELRPAERTLRDFTAVMLPGIATSLENARRTRPAA
jgi:exosortase A